MVHIGDPLCFLDKGSKKIDASGLCPKCRKYLSFRANTLSMICRCGAYVKRETLLECSDEDRPDTGPHIAVDMGLVEDPVHGVMERRQWERHKKAERRSGKKLGSGH